MKIYLYYQDICPDCEPEYIGTYVYKSCNCFIDIDEIERVVHLK